MSYFDDASLVFIPSGTKVSKAYSVKPIDGTGDLTFTRSNDTATRVNSAGLIESVLANVPRLDYLNSTCPKLLLEPQRTNVITFSEQLNNSDWTKQNSSITANATTSPDGNTNADKLIASAANAFHGIYNVTPTLTGLHTVSFYAKKGEYNFVTAQDQFSARYVASFNLDTGIVSSGTGASIQSVGNGWYRCIVTFDGGGVAVIPTWNPSPTNAAASYLGDGTSGVFVWGAQLEAGAYATSYIPTTTASVTRAADACSKTGISSLIGQTEGTLFVDFTLNGLADYGTPISVNDGTTTQYIWLTIFASGILRAELYDGTIQASISYSGAVAGGRYKMAFGYKANDFALYVNGALVGTDSTGNTFSGTTLSRVDTNITNAALYSTASESINQALLFKTRLTNAQLAELTTI